MADNSKVQAEAAAQAPAKVAVAVAETAEKVATESAKSAKRAAASAARRAQRQAAKNKASARRATRKSGGKSAAQPKPAKSGNGRDSNVNFDSSRWFAGFNAAPVAAPFQSLFAEAGERGQDAVQRSQKAVEEIADIARENVEALVESGRIAAEGARSLGQDLVESTRSGVEQTADAVRALAEAKSPTEFVQLQSEFARSMFDRFVAESSRLTETTVKLAGEAFQPISNRASVNAERFNRFVA